LWFADRYRSCGMELKKFVVGIDGSENATHGLHWALAIGERITAQVDALMSWTYPPFAGLPIVGFPLPAKSEMEAATQESLDAILQDEGVTGDISRSSATHGHPSAVLHEASKQADVVVLGRSGNSLLQRMAVGSTASYLAHHAHCPVAVIQTPTPQLIDGVGEVVVGVDGSPFSVAALVWALETFGQSRSVTARFCHEVPGLDQLDWDSDIRDRLFRQAEELLRSCVADALSQVDVDPAQLTSEIVSEDPRVALTETLTETDLLVLGARGHSGLTGLMVGSVTSYALRHSPSNLVVVRQ